MVTICEDIQILLDMNPRGVWAPKKAKISWDAKQSRSPPVLTGLLHEFQSEYGVDLRDDLPTQLRGRKQTERKILLTKIIC